MEAVLIIIKIAVAFVMGVIAGHAAVYIFNRIPAQWLCDYGEEPDPALMDRTVQRIKGYPWKLIYSFFFVTGAINLAVYSWQFSIAALAFCWALLEIGIADKKYGIIPDQFVIMVALTAIGFIPFYDSFWQHVYGACLGAGVMLAAAMAGKLISGKESLGFGDVKLMAAIGLALGFKGTMAVLVLSSLTSAIVFSVLLAKGKIKRTDMVPVGPCICGSAIFYVAIICPLL